MISKIQTQQLIANPRDLAQRKLQTHHEKGNKSQLSIFEVANLMDQLFFSNQNNSNQQSYFEICAN